MNRFFIYCNTNQAYEALTYNDIFCSELKQDLFRVATLSFLSNSFIFLSADKLSKDNRFIGIADEDNQYPVAFEISIPDYYDLSVRFVTRSDTGNYCLCDGLLPISYFGQIDDCIGAFVYGHIPFSFVSRIIFESTENKDRFFKSGQELWFPEDIFSVWEDEPYASLPKRTVNSSSLRSMAEIIDAELASEQKAGLDFCLLKQIHAKTVGYLALEATENWVIGNIRANLDSYIIKLLDPDTGELKKTAESVLDPVSDIFKFVDCRSFEQIDPALEDHSSEDYILLHAVLAAIEQNNYAIDKEVIRKIKEQLENEVLGIDLIRSSSLASKMESISTFVNSRIGDSEEMLEAVKGNSILYSLAICIKNKGKIEHVRLETAEMTQQVRRYTFILSGMSASMADINGAKKSAWDLERNLSDVCSLRYPDDTNMLIKPKSSARQSFGIVPQVYINVSADTFKAGIYEAEAERLNTLYQAEFADYIPEKEVHSYKNPIKVNMDGINYILDSPDSIEEFKKAIDKKALRKKTEFSKDLFLTKVLETDLGRKIINDVFRKYKGQKN